jgi:predicted NUDIX family NTP pyrophosphohydrolase
MGRSKQVSAGIILYRIKNKEIEIFLIHPGGPFNKRQYGNWSIPKGGVDDSDITLLDAAKREFKEETGLDISNSYEKLSKEKIKRGFKFTHFSSSKSKLKMFFIKNKVDYSKSISMYYLVKIE